MLLNMNKISIVTVCYNSEKQIENTILSVISQSYPNIEYIIEDGGSTDGTLDIIEKYRSKISAIYSEKDKGVFDAMNKAVLRSTGEWILFMNAGDRFHDNNAIEKLFCAEIPKNVGAIHGDTFFVKECGIQYIKCSPFYLVKGIRPMGICHQSILVRTALAKKYLFDMTFKYAADYNMMMRIYNDGFNFKYIPIAVSDYDLTGISSVHLTSQYKEVARICNETSGLGYYMGLFHAWNREFRLRIKSIMGYKRV